MRQNEINRVNEQTNVDTIIEKYDRESNYRKNLGIWGWLVSSWAFIDIVSFIYRFIRYITIAIARCCASWNRAGSNFFALSN